MSLLKKIVFSFDRDHMSAEHKREKYLPCSKCGKMLKTGTSLRSHLKRCDLVAKKVPCPDCKMEFKRDEDMEAHRVVHFGQITCPEHNILFKDEDDVCDHFSIMSATEAGKDKSDKVRLECCMCRKPFKHMCLFMKHLRQHLGIAAYRCKVNQLKNVIETTTILLSPAL